METLVKIFVLLIHAVIFGAVIVESILQQQEKYEKEKEKR